MARIVEDPEYRSPAAPGLDEDELFAAMQGLPGRGALWGEGRPDSFGPSESGWDAARERHARHARLMAKWEPTGT